MYINKIFYSFAILSYIQRLDTGPTILFLFHYVHSKVSSQILVSMKAQLGFSMPLFLPNFLFCFVDSNHNTWASSRPSPSLGRFHIGIEGFNFNLSKHNETIQQKYIFQPN